MKMDCPEVERIVTPWVDGEASAADQARIGQHLASCQPCRRKVAAQAVARQVLRARAASLVGHAPLGLRAQCAGLSAAPATRPLGAWRTRLVPLAAAVALVLAVGGGVVYATRGSNTSLATQLALDHLKCFALFEQASGPADAEALASMLQRTYGWQMKVPAGSDGEHLRLVGGRRCFSTDGRVAHILYRHDGHALSLFLVPDTARAAATLAVIGHHALIWSRNRTTYVVVSREPEADLTRVAGYLRRVLD
jgi:anti-sigma factor RsiW